MMTIVLSAVILCLQYLVRGLQLEMLLMCYVCRLFDQQHSKSRIMSVITTTHMVFNQCYTTSHFCSKALHILLHVRAADSG